MESDIKSDMTEGYRYAYIYVYGLIDKDINRGIKGLKNKTIEKVKFKDIWVLTSPYPNLHPMVKEDEVMYHANILKKIAKRTAVIPMSFGTVFKNQEILEAVLEKSYYVIKDTLEGIRGKIELGVKVLKNPDSDDTYDKLASEILESLNKLSVKSVQGDRFSERLLLNHSFLVEKSRFSEFSEKIGELEMNNKDLKFVYTGPWPPYSFINIKIAGGS